MTDDRLHQLAHQLATDTSSKIAEATANSEEYITAMKAVIAQMQSFIDAIDAIAEDTY